MEVKALIKKAHEAITRNKKEYSPNVHEIQNWINQHLKTLPMNLSEIEVGMMVFYIPKHLTGAKIEIDQYGIVTSKNSKYAFVRYAGDDGSRATSPSDLYSCKDRPDLMEKFLSN